MTSSQLSTIISKNTLLLIAILLGTPLLASEQICLDTDGDGWGWNGSSSCLVSADCIDTDGDGWGWNGVDSCRIDNIETHDRLTVCIDTDGDGWGWNGRNSCRPEVSCVDMDGDGWGWDGRNSCIASPSALVRISNFEVYPPYSPRVVRLGEHHYARLFENNTDFMTSVFRLSAEESHVRIDGPVAPPVPEPQALWAFDGDLIWATLTPESTVKLHRLNNNGERTEACTNGRTNNGTCNPGTLGELSFIKTLENAVVIYDLNQASTRILDGGSDDARIPAPYNDKPVYLSYGPEEIGDYVYAFGYQDRDNRQFGVWRSDALLQQFTPVVHPDVTSSIGGGYVSGNRFIAYSNGSTDNSASPSILYAENSNNSLTRLPIATQESLQLVQATDNRMFFNYNESNQLGSIALSTGEQIQYPVYDALSYNAIALGSELFFRLCTARQNYSCTSTDLYGTKDSGLSVERISTNLSSIIASHNDEVYFIAGGQLNKVDADQNTTVIPTGQVSVSAIVDSQDGIYVRGQHPQWGDQLWGLW